MSVVIPTHNRCEFLGRALASALGQTLGDLEVIVVDDGSSDDTPAALAAVRDERVRAMRIERSGVGAARNRGIVAARGEWLAFLDDDNEWDPGYLARMLAVARASGADVVSCLAREQGPDGIRHSQPAPPDADPLRAITWGWYPFTSCVVVRRRALDAVGGFPEDVAVHEDWDLLIRLALRGRWVTDPSESMTRHRHARGHLGDDDEAGRVANEVIDARLGHELRRRVGHRAYARWYRWHCGEVELQLLLARRDRPIREVRAAARAALRRLARRLPWSMTSMVRPGLVLLVGPRCYERVQAVCRSGGSREAG